MAARRPPTFDVYVGNLPSESNERNVGKLFTSFGEIASILVKESAKAKGPNNKFAFVKFLCEPDAERAVAEMDKQKLQGSDTCLVVRKADKENKFEYNKKKYSNENQGRKGAKASDTAPPVGWGEDRIHPLPTRQSDSNDGSTTGSTGFQGGGGDGEREPETAMVTHVETPITLWVQIVNDENTKRIFSITEQLASLCPAANHVTGQPEPGKVYACLFTEDSMWYRCQTKQSLGTDRYKIQYIDYGNTEEVPVHSLVEIPPSLANIKPLAIKISLHNTRANDLSDKQAMQYLKSITDNQMSQLTRVRALADGSGFYGMMFVNGQSVGDAMVQAGHCHSRPAFGKSPGKPNEAGDAPGPQMMSTSLFSNKGGKQQQDNIGALGGPMPLLSQPPPPIGVPHPMGFHMQGGHIDSSKEKELQLELSKKRRELEMVKNDKDSANLQLEYMRSKLKTLQDEFAASAAKLQEDTLSKRIMTLTSLAAMVRRLRDQFPTNKNKVCLLEEAIDICSASDRVDNSRCTTLSEVGSALARYKAAQDEISKCKEQEEIAELVESRDDARKELHNKLSRCLDELQELPLETRNKQVQEFQGRLAVTYSDYMKFQIPDCPSLDNLVPGFRTWKSKKDAEFTDIRMATDFCEEALQTSLSQVKQRISVETLEIGEKSEVDIDELMKTYAHALQREISVTDQSHSKDANLVATVVMSVMRELQLEANSLENFQVLRSEFETRRQVIEPWLDQKPEFKELQENRKTLRSLKSKLRHTLADKIDLEESGSKEELVAIKQEVEKLQVELQATLAKSDSLLGEVASLADSNFPELILQYPDLGIDNYLLYKGLVKSNREIDHYCLTDSFRPGVHISKFNGETVIIQEFHIGDGEHCSKEDFLKQIVQYNGDSRHIHTVFFSKNERQAYTQSPWEDSETLEACLASDRFSARDLQQLSRQLVELVVALNSRGCVHGEITPPNIFCRKDIVMYLMNPDFSKPVKERLTKRFVTNNGLVFQTPELQYTSPEIIGAAADVYNVVLLLNIIHCPDGRLPVSRGRGTSLDPSLQQLFERFMSGKNLSRVTAENLLQLDYFSRTIQDAPSPVSPLVQPAAVSPLLQPVAVSPPLQPAAVSPPLQPAAVSPLLQPAAVSPPPPPLESQLQVPFIKSTDEPMEIGVFRAEDYIVTPGLDIAAGVNNFDTDDSWTTKSTSSASSGSRVESPLEAALEVKAEASTTESLQTVIEADCNSGDTAVISGNSSDFGETVCAGEVSNTGVNSAVKQKVTEDGETSGEVDSVSTSHGPEVNGITTVPDSDTTDSTAAVEGNQC